MKVALVVHWDIDRPPENRFDVQVVIDDTELWFRDQYATHEDATKAGSKAFWEAGAGYFHFPEQEPLDAE